MRRAFAIVCVLLLGALSGELWAREESATCTRVIDGDTIEVRIGRRVEKVWLIGVDTPETVHPNKPVEYFGKEASAFTKHMVWKKRVLLRDDPMNRTRDRYDRLLRYVLLEDGTLVNAEIIRQGYGFAHTPSRLRRSSASCSGRRGKRALDRRIQTVIAILEKQWNKRVDVRLTARMVRLSPSHLEHLFKQQVRICIRDFIQEKRLHAAAVQLAITYERVSTICFLVGFTDVSNFNHAFKRKFGLSPRQYRDRASLSARRSNQEIATATKK